MYALPLICLTLLLNDAVATNAGNAATAVFIFNTAVSPGLGFVTFIWNEPDAELVKKLPKLKFILIVADAIGADTTFISTEPVILNEPVIPNEPVINALPVNGNEVPAAPFVPEVPLLPAVRLEPLITYIVF